MSTDKEMRAIRATFTAQGVQETFALQAAGYVEASVLSPCYPFLPIADSPQTAAIDRERSNREFLSTLTNRYGHCSQ